MKPMESLQDLIEEAKLRTVWWILCIFAVSYFLTHTSKSMLMNIPIAILFLIGLRILLNEVDFRWKVRDNGPKSYSSHLGKKQLAVNDSRLTTPPPPQKWRRKIDSPIVEEAIEDFINKILHDFVIDLWYSVITPDKEAPELMRSIIMDAIGEVCGKVKEINLVDLLTRDVVDLIGDHLDLFRRNQAAIGVDVMVTLSSEERDERLKHHLLASKELHPALISPDCEYKVLQRLVGGLLAVVLRPREAQSPLVRCMAREFLTCLVIQPVMNFASPMYINELIEYIIIAYNSEGYKKTANSQSPNVEDHNREHTVFGEQGLDIESSLRKSSPSGDHGELYIPQLGNRRVIQTTGGSGDLISSAIQGEPIQARHADWARAFEAATQRRTEVLMPENLENMWAIGRNYKKKLQNKAGSGLQALDLTGSSSVRSTLNEKKFASELPKQKSEIVTKTDDKTCMQLPPRPQVDYRQNDPTIDASSESQALNKVVFTKGSSSVHQRQSTAVASLESRKNLKRSSSTPDLNVLSNIDDDMFDGKRSTPIINEYYISDTGKKNMNAPMSSSDKVLCSERENIQKLRSRVVGAYFERLGSKSFAVYNILVIDTDNNSWCVKRRYRNFERLHRHLKDIPNYTLHLPPKRFFSSSTEDAFVHQRCIHLDKYLQDLLSIANVAEQHEVWDFLSASSKNYSFGKSASVMKTFAGNVDDAVDDILRQFKGVSDGLMWIAPGLPSWSLEQDGSVMRQTSSGYTDDISKLTVGQSITDSMNSFSDNDDDDDKDANQEGNKLDGVGLAAGTLSDYHSNSKQFQKKIVKYNGEIGHLDLQDNQASRLKSDASIMNRPPEPSLTLTSEPQEDPIGVPLEWTPPNLSVPVLNLVDNIFQLNRRGWLRRQVFWISKQILQLIMEDAIDDWLLMQIQWLRREDVIAQGIRWVHDVLWPDGTFFLKLQPRGPQSKFEATVEPELARQPGGVRAPQLSFEQHLEAARRASDVKKMIFNGAPSPLVSLIGHKQYRHCARDVYYFLQSSVCLKQLGYGILELVLISIFPELRDVVKDIHEKMPIQSV